MAPVGLREFKRSGVANRVSRVYQGRFGEVQGITQSRQILPKEYVGDTGTTATPARIAPKVSTACWMLFSDRIMIGALSGPKPWRISQVATAAVSREAAA